MNESVIELWKKFIQEERAEAKYQRSQATRCRTELGKGASTTSISERYCVATLASMHDAIAAGRDASADQAESHLRTFEQLSDAGVPIHMTDVGPTNAVGKNKRWPN